MEPRIILIGRIWKSEANGWVYHRGGVSPTICCGAHSGVQPKIMEVCEMRKREYGTKVGSAQ